MKVYGGCFFYQGRQVHGIVAGTQKQVAKVTGSSLGYIRGWWSPTGNKKEVEMATKNPGVLFWCENDYANQEYHRFDNFE